MKKNSLAIIMLLVSFAAFAHYSTAKPKKTVSSKWVSDKGYWVAESNVNSPRSTTIYFYTNNNIQVYKEEVEGRVLKLAKRKIKITLKIVLEHAVNAYAQSNRQAENQLWVIHTLNRN